MQIQVAHRDFAIHGLSFLRPHRFKGFSPLFRLYELRLFPKEGIGIIGAAKPHHLDEAVKALQVNLNREEIAALEELYQPHPILGSD